MHSSFEKEQILFENWRQFLNDGDASAGKAINEVETKVGGLRSTWTKQPTEKELANLMLQQPEPVATTAQAVKAPENLKITASGPPGAAIAPKVAPAPKPPSWDAERKGINKKYKTAKLAARKLKGPERAAALKAAKSDWRTARRANWKKRPANVRKSHARASEKRRDQKIQGKKGLDRIIKTVEARPTPTVAMATPAAAPTVEKTPQTPTNPIPTHIGMTPVSSYEPANLKRMGVHLEESKE